MGLFWGGEEVRRKKPENLEKPVENTRKTPEQPENSHLLLHLCGLTDLGSGVSFWSLEVGDANGFLTPGRGVLVFCGFGGFSFVFFG